MLAISLLRANPCRAALGAETRYASVHMDATTQLILTLLVAGAGGYLGSYLREKGKNLATKEDLEPIVRGQETIKQQIAHTGFVQQRGWELKREVIWDIFKLIAEIEAAAIDLNSLCHPKATPDDKLADLRASVHKRIMASAVQTLALNAISASLISDPKRDAVDESLRNLCGGLPGRIWLDGDEFAELLRLVKRANERAQALAKAALFDDPMGYTRVIGST
jgi:hypothetical protein